MSSTTAFYSDLSDYLVSGYWRDAGEAAHSFAGSGSGKVTITYDMSLLTSSGQKLALAAMDAWKDVANIRFEEVSFGAQITFGDDAAGAFSSSTYFNGVTREAEINVSRLWLTNYGSEFDDYTYSTYIHEIGHALGLGHTGDYNGSAFFWKDSIFDYDSTQISVMSYFDPTENPNVDASRAEVLTPQLADILAIQSIYGAPDKIRGGDTVYGDGTNLKDARWKLGNLDSIWSLTLVDTGGTDTVNMSKSKAAQVIDLRQGVFSSVDGGKDNLAIAPGTVIENAVGGSGKDVLQGNAAANSLSGMAKSDTLKGRAGNDKLNGNGGADFLAGEKGNDRLVGGRGSDTFLFRDGDGQDRILDFQDDTDQIKLDSNLWNNDLSVTQVIKRFASVNDDGDVVLDFWGEDQLVIEDLGARGLLKDDLIIV